MVNFSGPLRIRLVRISAALTASLALLTSPQFASGACNLFPGTEKTFGSVLGAANRPFAAPGELVELRIRGCETARSQFRDEGSDHVVTVAIKPAGRAPLLVAVTTDCANVPAGACGATPVVCDPVAPAHLATVADPDLGDRRLIFRFPSSTSAGPAAIAVTRAGDPLPCALASDTCATQSGVLACVDRIYFEDGACGTTAPDDTFAQFTALPPPNDFAAACFREDPPCDPVVASVRATVDASGNVLLPFVWQRILVRDDDVPVPRLLRARIRPPVPLRIPDETFLGSFTPEGGRLPPILEPQQDPTVADPNVLTLFGSADAPYTVLQAARRHGTCVGGRANGERCTRRGDCPGGTCETSCVDAPAQLCGSDADCATGRCGALFDLATLTDAGGQLVLPRLVPGFCQLPPHAPCSSIADCPAAGDQCVSYALEAQNPVPLEGLASSDIARSFTARESIDAVDRNGDGDITDSVVSLRDRVTGLGEALGAAAGCSEIPASPAPEGRAVVRVNEPPFTFPAVAVENDLLAFLESESSAGWCDQNDDGDRADAILRVFRLGGGEQTALVDPPRAADAAPRINGASLAVSGGLVFTRMSEAAMARQTTVRASVATNGTPGNDGSTLPSLSGDGSRVVFDSDATSLLPPGTDTNDRTDAYLRDLIAETTARVSLTRTGGEAGGFFFGGPGALFPRLSSDATTVSFSSRETNLLGPDDANSVNDIFVRDLTVPTTELMSVGTDGTQGDLGSTGVGAISADGRFVAFVSPAETLLGPAGDTNGESDVFVRDRCVAAGVPVTGCTPTLERVSVRTGGTQSDGGDVYLGSPAISADGRFVAWYTNAEDLLGPENDTNGGFADVFLHDRMTDVTEIVARTVTGAQPATGAGIFVQAISADGRFVVFDSSSNDVLGLGVDTNGFGDIFVRDRLLGTTTRVSVPTGVREAGGGSSSAAQISADGRYIAFYSDATDLIGPGRDGNNGSDIFLHDRVTGVTDRVSIGLDGSEPNALILQWPSLSADGRYVAFHTFASNLIGPGNDTNGVSDVFVRGPDRSDPFGIDALLFEDGELDDTVLEVFDPATGATSTLCPAGDVAVAAGNAAFLRPESILGTPACPGGSRNAEPGKPDGDVADEVVHLSLAGAPALNLGRAATAVAMSDTLLAALVSEPADGVTDYNDDDDEDDTVVQVHPVGSGAWTNVGQAADALAVAGRVAAFATPEAEQGDGPLNGDGDASDRVLQIWDADAVGPTPKLIPVGQAIEELVLGERAATACGDRQLVAFRTSELAQGDGPLNGDGDSDDAVLQVYDVVTRDLVPTGQAATPCRLEACDPRAPYRISGSKVTFLTFETEQDEDLDGNRTIGELVLQVFDVCTRVTTVLGAVETTPGGSDPFPDVEDNTVFSSKSGRCAVTPAAACDPLAGTGCAEGTFCNAATARCTLLAPPTCGPTAACPSGSECIEQVITVATSIADGDGDGVPDDVDLCPSTPDPLQVDADRDGVGDACDAAVTGCAALPLAGCASMEGHPSRLRLWDRERDANDKLVLEWQAPPGDGFGDPRSEDAYALCLYDASGPTPALLSESQAPAGGECRTSLRGVRTEPCWNPLPTGFRYDDREATPNGLTRIRLRALPASDVTISARGRGVNLPDPALPLPLPLRAQIQRSGGGCWEEIYEGDDVVVNDARQFYGVSD